MRNFIIKSITFILLITGASASYSFDEATLDRLRKVYPRAYEDAESCKTELATLDKRENKGVLLAYQAAFNMVYARHLSSPLSKLNIFKKGKNLMDKAIAQNKNNTEIHFLRLTIQVHAPSILNYRQDIQRDLDIILSNWKNITEENLKKNIREFLNDNTSLLTQEQQKLIAS